MSAVRITKCEAKLTLVKAVNVVTHKSLLESKNIVDSIMRYVYDNVTGEGHYTFGILQLNRSSVSEEQWEKIVKMMHENHEVLEYEYIE